MKIQRIKVNNFKAIKDFDEELNGSNVLLLGDNEKGKSSLIEAIQAAFGDSSMAYEDSINWDSKTANIKVYTDSDGNQYRFEVKMKKGRERPIIEVTYPDGKKSNKLSVIGGLVGEVRFDAESFVALSSTVAGRRKQVDVVKSFLPQDIQDELSSNELRVKEHYDKRTEANRELKFLELKITNTNFDVEKLEKFAELKDIMSLQQQLEEGINNNQKQEDIFKETDQLTIDIENLNQNINLAQNNSKDRIFSLKSKMEKIKEEIHHQEELIKTQKQEFILEEKNKYKQIEANKVLIDNHVPIDIENIKNEIQSVSDFNTNVHKSLDFKTLVGDHMKQEEVVNDLTAIIELSKQAIEDTIRSIELPIKGLKFDDEQLYWNDIPVTTQTLSTSQIMELGVLIKMSKNTNAKVVLIERGESLGKNKLNNLFDIAKKYGWQLIIEKVDSNYDELKLELC